jgi:hypothetical protein
MRRVSTTWHVQFFASNEHQRAYRLSQVPGESLQDAVSRGTVVNTPTLHISRHWRVWDVRVLAHLQGQTYLIFVEVN